jgi:phage gp46-like protein
MSVQQGDVKLFQTDDDGDITIEDGIVLMSGGLETAAYLSLFGGNYNDDGRDGSDMSWWGNIGENEVSRQYRSSTQNLLQSIPSTASNLIRIEDAAKSDLEWFVQDNIATSVEVEATIPAVNRVKLNIKIDALGEESSFEFVENWKAEL